MDGNKDFQHDEAVTLRPSAPAPRPPVPDTLPAPVDPASPVLLAPDGQSEPQARQPEPQQAYSQNQNQDTFQDLAPQNAAYAADDPYQQPGGFDPSVPLDDGPFGGAAPLPVTDREAYDLQTQPTTPDLTWRASEFVSHPKDAKWYLTFMGISAVVVVVAYLLTKEVFTAIVLVISAALFGYMASRQPRELQYALSATGVYVGQKFYPYTEFNAFAVVEEGKAISIDFMPLKRFAPTLNVYCDPAIEDEAMEYLALHLPYSDHQRNAVDGLMHRIRF